MKSQICHRTLWVIYPYSHCAATTNSVHWEELSWEDGRPGPEECQSQSCCTSKNLRSSEMNGQVAWHSMRWPVSHSISVLCSLLWRSERSFRTARVILVLLLLGHRRRRCLNVMWELVSLQLFRSSPFSFSLSWLLILVQTRATRMGKNED